jgi:hypothetical protein
MDTDPSNDANGLESKPGPPRVHMTIQSIGFFVHFGLTHSLHASASCLHALAISECSLSRIRLPVDSFSRLRSTVVVVASCDCLSIATVRIRYSIKSAFASIATYIHRDTWTGRNRKGSAETTYTETLGQAEREKDLRKVDRWKLRVIAHNTNAKHPNG